MYTIHKFNQSNSILVANLSDDELMSCIEFRCSMLAESLVKYRGALSVTGDEIGDAILGASKLDFRGKAGKIEEHYEKLMPYVMEAALRGLPDLTDVLQKTFNRKTMIASAFPIGLDDLPF